MKITTTDDKEINIPETCGYCQIDAEGNHDPKCPCYIYAPPSISEIDGTIIITLKYHPTIQQDVNVYEN